MKTVQSDEPILILALKHKRRKTKPSVRICVAEVTLKIRKNNVQYLLGMFMKQKENKLQDTRFLVHKMKISGA